MSDALLFLAWLAPLAALPLALGGAGRWWTSLATLVLAGAPFTSGALAKDLLKTALLEAPAFWPGLLTWMLLLTAAGTTLLMGRFLYLMHRAAGSAESAGAASALPWLGLMVLSLGLPLVHGGFSFAVSDTGLILAAAIAAGAMARRRPAALAKWVGRIPPGDVLEPLLRILRRSISALRMLGTRCCTSFGRGLRKGPSEYVSALVRATQAAETALRERAAAGPLWLTVAGAAFLLGVLRP